MNIVHYVWTLTVLDVNTTMYISETLKRIGMATIKEDYVSFETAKLLKEKGFNEETEYVYSNNGELLRLSHLGIKDLTNADCNGYHTWQFPIEGVASIISAPTLQMAMKWLREVHNLHIDIRININNSLCSFQIYSVGVSGARAFTEYRIKSYEAACEEAIKYCLENLI